MVERVDRLARALMILAIGWSTVRPVFGIAVEITADHFVLPMSLLERELWSACLAAITYQVHAELVLVGVALLAEVVAVVSGVRHSASAWFPVLIVLAACEVGCIAASACGLDVPAALWRPIEVCASIAFIATVATAAGTADELENGRSFPLTQHDGAIES